MKKEFIVEKNDLNGHWMLYSKHPDIPNCYSFKSKNEANKGKEKLNELLENQ